MVRVDILDTEEKKRRERIGYQRKFMPEFGMAESGCKSARLG